MFQRVRDWNKFNVCKGDNKNTRKHNSNLWKRNLDEKALCILSFTVEQIIKRDWNINVSIYVCNSKYDGWLKSSAIRYIGIDIQMENVRSLV